MSSPKFNLFSKASLSALVGGLRADAADAAPKPGEPAPNDDGGAETTDEPADEGQPKTTQPSDTPADGEEGEEGEGGPDAAAGPAEVVAMNDAIAVADARYTAGRADANARMSAVFASAGALANPSLAAFLLSNAPDASADAVIAQLGSAPKGSAPAAAAGGIPDTDIDLGRGDAQAQVEAGSSAAPAAADSWDKSFERVGAITGATSARSDAGGFVMSSVPAGGHPVAGQQVTKTGN